MKTTRRQGFCWAHWHRVSVEEWPGQVDYCSFDRRCLFHHLNSFQKVGCSFSSPAGSDSCRPVCHGHGFLASPSSAVFLCLLNSLEQRGHLWRGSLWLNSVACRGACLEWWHLTLTFVSRPGRELLAERVTVCLSGFASPLNDRSVS